MHFFQALALLTLFNFVQSDSQISGSLQIDGHKNYKIGCYFDVNNDRYTDVAVFDGNKVAIATWDHNTHSSKFNIWGTFETANSVAQIIPGNFGGKEIDLLIIGKNETSERYAMEIFTKIENKDKFESLDSIKDKLSSINLANDDPNVLLFDSRADMKMDILYKSTVSDDETSLKILQTAGDNNGHTYEFLANYGSRTDTQSIELNSVGWIDIDQDCKSDLVFTMNSKIYYMRGGVISSDKSEKYWSYDTSNSHSLHEIKIDNSKSKFTTLDDYDMSSIIFADFDRNGSPDILIKHKTHLQLVLLLQKKSYTGNICKKYLNSVEMKRIDLNLTDIKIKESEYKWPDSGTVNTVMLAADIDFDQNPEITLVLQRKDNSNIDIFFANFDTQTDKLTNSKIKSNTNKYHWNEISQISFYQNGDLMHGYYYIVINGKYKSSSDETVFITVDWRENSQNQLRNEHYYLSVCPLRSKKDTSLQKTMQYIDTFNGVTVKINFHDDYGSIYLGGFIRYQTNSKTLQLPCALIGLEATNNYIEQLMIGYPLHTKKENYHVYSQPGVPPKTKLYLFPDPGQDPDGWVLESFLSPFITWQVLAIVVTIICCILGLMVFYFDYKQRKASKKESEIDNPGNRFLF